MKRWDRSVRTSWVGAACALSVACSGGSELDASVDSTTEELGPADAELLAKTIVPARPLVTPGSVYLKSVEETIASVGTLPHRVHVYNPTQGGTVRFVLTAKTTAGATDSNQRFRSAKITPIIGSVPGTPRTYSESAGSATYTWTGAAAGWYRLTFDYEAVNPDRVLAFRADNGGSTSLKMAWVDPVGVNMQVKAVARVDSPVSAYFKGGAYRNTSPTTNAYADNIKLDGRLLYRRAFDQQQFNYPLGVLQTGDHTLEFSLTKTGDMRAKFWFGMNEKSFDLLGTKTRWSAAQFVYDGETRTGDYDAWNEGVAFAQGASLSPGVRPPPVRRGNVFVVALDHAALCAGNATVRVYAVGSTTPTGWATQRPTDTDYSGGIYGSAGFEARCRETWRVTVPATAAVGRYVLRATTPSGTVIGNDILFYVLHNPFSSAVSNLASPGQIAAYAYDDDFDGMALEHDSVLDLDVDTGNDHFLAQYIGFGPYYQQVKFTGAFRRTGAPTDYSLLDYAVAAADGTTSEFESMRRLYRIVAQRFLYGGRDTGSDTSGRFMGAGTSFSPEHAFGYSRPGSELPPDSQIQGLCYATASTLASLARTVGLLSRQVVSAQQLGGWGDHSFAEVLIPNLPQHGGRTAPSSTSSPSDTDPWYAFDATSPAGFSETALWSTYSEAVGPRSQFGRASLIIFGSYPSSMDAVTNYPGWNPYLSDFDQTSSVWDVTNDYVAGPEFWMTGNLTGWLGRGEKDVFRISKSATGARAVRVTTLTGGNLRPKLCIGSASSVPVMPERCAAPATRQVLPNGESYVVVFSDTLDARSLFGDTVQYSLELEF